MWHKQNRNDLCLQETNIHPINQSCQVYSPIISEMVHFSLLLHLLANQHPVHHEQTSVSPAAPLVASPSHRPHCEHPPSVAPHKARLSPTASAHVFPADNTPGLPPSHFSSFSSRPPSLVPQAEADVPPDAASSESPQPSHPCTGKAALSVLPSRLAVSLRAQCSPLQALRTECWVQQGLDKHLTASREDRRTVQKHISTHRHDN